MFCMTPTPIHAWDLPNVPVEFKVSVKREDLTGSLLTGNKIRKLEFILADALQSNCDCVVTTGGVGSNHARATALAARQLNLDSHLFLITKSVEDKPKESIPISGNYLLHRMCNANIYFLPPNTGFKTVIQNFGEKLRSQNHRPYVIPPGGYSLLGCWGYISGWQEMMDQGVLNDYDDVVAAAGSTGCVCGLAMSNYLTGSKLKIHGMSIAFSVDMCYKFVQKHLDEFGVKADARDIVNFIDCIGKGYGMSSEDDLSLIMSVMARTGLYLDTDYTVKAMKGMLTEMKERPHIFKGNRVLFIHTGGVFGMYDGRINKCVEECTDGNVQESYYEVHPED